MTDAAKALIIQNGYDPAYGARPLKRYLQSHAETLIARTILSGDLHAGDTSCKRLVERTYGGFLHLFGVDRGDRSGQIDATHIAVAHDDHLVDLAGILGERHVEHGALADAQLLRDVSQHGEDQFGVIVFDPDRVFAFGVRRRAALRSLFEDRNADQRRARSVLDMAGHLPALLGIGPEAPACRHEPQAQGPYDRHTQSAPSGGAGPMK